ncbi:hypothetical protein ATCC90586_005506 [Pythium insidiosum]|nr:hypothetical protein ATCC90586_005506 [Pythium insidiosum]
MSDLRRQPGSPRFLSGSLSDTPGAGPAKAAALFPSSGAEQLTVPPDAKAVTLELQSLRRRERELGALVEDLQTEQRVAKERLALYSILALKLKRELINERLAHIDSRKEIDELRSQLNISDASTNSPDVPRVKRSSTESDRRTVERQDSSRDSEEDPWTSPIKSGEDPTTAGSTSLAPLSFGSFYSSRQPNTNDEDDEEASSGMQPLRNSLMGQFLPSALLDSPQLTPTARSTSSKTAADNQVDDEVTSDRPLSDDENDEDTAAASSHHLPSATEDESIKTATVLEHINSD